MEITIDSIEQFNIGDIIELYCNKCGVLLGTVTITKITQINEGPKLAPDQVLLNKELKCQCCGHTSKIVKFKTQRDKTKRGSMNTDALSEMVKSLLPSLDLPESTRFIIEMDRSNIYAYVIFILFPDKTWSSVAIRHESSMGAVDFIAYALDRIAGEYKARPTQPSQQSEVNQ